jgi:RiboL-PSP-HEPN
MHPILRELNARLDELATNVGFVALATSLRPRLADILNWQHGGEALDLARRFMNADANRPESFYGALLVRALGAFERFMRLLVDEAATRTADRAESYDHVKEHIRNRHTVLTGRLLGSIEEPRDHLVVDVQQLAKNLASCGLGATQFRFNSSAFSAAVTNVSPSVIERALGNLSIVNWQDAVGRSLPMQHLLGTRGTRDTNKAASKRLEELCRRRNQIAHAGDGEVTITEADVLDAIRFLRAYAEALEHEVDARLSA